jgi:hypothetical protein
VDDRQLAERLSDVGEATPPPDLAGRVRATVRRRRARAAVTLSVVGVLCLGAGVVALRGTGPEPARPAPPATGPPTAEATPGPPTRPATLAELFPGRTPRTVPRRLSDGRPFRAFALGSTGTLVGVDQSFDAAGFDRWSDLVVLDPLRGTEAVVARPELGFTVTDGRFTTWVANTGPSVKSNLFCHDAATGAQRRVSDGSVWESSVAADAGRLAWTYYGGEAEGIQAYTVAVSDGCGPERRLAVRGYVSALRGPFLYLSRFPGAGADWGGPTGMRRYHLGSGRDEPLPLEVPPGAARWEAAAGPRALLWTPIADSGAPGPLRALDLALSREVLVDERPPHAVGANGATTRLTAGDRLLAYASSPVDGPPAASRGIVYDPETRSVVRLPGEAFAAGGWLVWLEGDAYRLLDVS